MQMEKQKPYLSFSYPPPGPTGFLFKKAAERNAQVMRELTIDEHREALVRLADVRVISPGIRTELVSCDGVPCQWVYRDESPPSKVLMYVHGGSWAYNNLKTARPVGKSLTEASGYRVLVVEYRLSPEHPYPAAPDDCYTVYRWLLEQGYASENIALFGDSAGGNLVLSLTHRLLLLGEPLPAALGLASPVTDLSQQSEIQRGKPDLLFTQYQGREENIFHLYLGDADPEDPLLSPVRGDLSRFPPMLIHVGQEEHLCVDCDLFAQKAHDQGANVKLKIWRELFHDFTIIGNTFRESRKSMAEFGAFFREYL